ncbi:MAG: LysR family transcriptional regulator [Noviherbaspirillum sp.]
MPDNVTIRQLRYFLAAAETGQFSMAATREHVSQSAITNAIHSLEGELGVRLFYRLPQGVSLTVEGQDFLSSARHILDSARDAMHKPRFHASGLQGAVRIAASYTLLGYFLPELLARFRASYPDVEIDLQDLDRENIEAAVLGGDIDLGVVILSNISRLERFGHSTLIRSRRQLWVAPAHPLGAISSPSLSDIAQHPYILLTADEGERSAMQYWKVNRIEPNIGFRTSSIEALRGLVAHGFGVTILSDLVFRPWSLEGKRIEARPILDVVPHMDAGTIWRKSGQMTKQAEVFQQFLSHAYGIQ